MTSKVELECPNCKDQMIKSYDGEAKLRMKLVVWNQDGMFAICKSCGKDVEIKPEIIKSIQSRFVYEVEK